MKKISTLALGLALLAGSAVTAKAQITVPKVSDDTNTYLYYLQNAGQNEGYYVTTTVGDNNVVKYAKGKTISKLQVKLVASGTDSKYNIVATNLGDDVETTYIGVAGTSSANSVTYYTEAAKQNAEWSVTATTHSSAKGYFPLYNIALTSSLGWNMYGGTTGSTVALYANTDQGNGWNFIPADITTLKALATDIQSDLDATTTTASKDAVTSAITAANAVSNEDGVLTAAQTLLQAYGEFLFNKIVSKKPTVTASATPEDGKAYTITCVSNAYEKCYMNYTSGTGYGLVATTALSNADYPESAKLICRKVGDGQYVFVNAEGKYFGYKGKDAGINNNKGYNDSYSNECVVTFTNQSASVAYTSTLSTTLSCVYAKFPNVGNGRVFVINYGSNGTSTPIYDQAFGQFYNIQYSSALLLEETSYPNTVTFNDATGIDNVEKIATFSAPFPTVIPTDVKAYYISGTTDDNATATVKAVSGDAIPANTGVLLTAGSGVTSLAMVPATDETVATITGNVLENTAGKAKTIAEGDNAYILAKSGEVVAFYKAKVGTELAMNKAYLPVTTEASSILMNFNGSTTGISTVQNDAAAKAPVYDLTGRRVNKAVKGSLYIQGGRKFIAK